MSVRVNLVDVRSKKIDGDKREKTARKPPVKPNMVIREQVMEPVRKEKPKAFFMCDLGNRK
ncbi:MAG: hypothetical protein ISR64_04655 [Deltaproteobacteria bacterium]|nr:hypothetical protein [Deltaproteobacteria bacterium]